MPERQFTILRWTYFYDGPLPRTSFHFFGPKEQRWTFEGEHTLAKLISSIWMTLGHVAFDDLCPSI